MERDVSRGGLRTASPDEPRPKGAANTSIAVQAGMNSVREPQRIEDALPRLRELPERIDRVEYLARMLPIVLGRAKQGAVRRE